MVLAYVPVWQIWSDWYQFQKCFGHFSTGQAGKPCSLYTDQHDQAERPANHLWLASAVFQQDATLSLSTTGPLACNVFSYLHDVFLVSMKHYSILSYAGLCTAANWTTSEERGKTTRLNISITDQIQEVGVCPSTPFIYCWLLIRGKWNMHVSERKHVLLMDLIDYH